MRTKPEVKGREAKASRMSDALAWVAPFAIAVAVHFVSGQSDVAAPDLGFVAQDKLIHFCVFGALATAILRVPPLRSRPLAGAVVAIACTSLFGIADELHQGMTPGRMMDAWDWAADTAGAAVAALLYHGVGPYRRFMEWRVPGFRGKTRRAGRLAAPVGTGYVRPAEETP